MAQPSLRTHVHFRVLCALLRAIQPHSTGDDIHAMPSLIVVRLLLHPQQKQATVGAVYQAASNKEHLLDIIMLGARVSDGKS